MIEVYYFNRNGGNKMIIDMNKDRTLLIKLYEEFNKRKPSYKKAYDYYLGKTDIQVNYKTTDRSNAVIKDNRIKAFVEEEVAYSVGQPVTYVNKSKEINIVSDIHNSLSDINTTLDVDLNTAMLIYGEAYELHYLNNEEFKAKVITPLHGIAYTNTEGEVELFLYFYKKMLDDKTYVDIIDDVAIYHYEDNFSTIIQEVTPHYFKKCPVAIARLTNGLEDTIYYTIKSLQDAYELAISDSTNEISDTRLAYLVLQNVSVEEEDLVKMKSNGIMQLEGSNTDAKYLIKNLNSDFITKHKETLINEMYAVTNHLNNQTDIQSNTSGAMLATRLNCLRIKITVQQKCLKEAIKKRIKDLFTYLNIAYSKNYSHKDVDINFTLNLPSNDVEMAQIISQLNGKLSITTGLAQLSFVSNAEEEFEKMIQEQKRINKALSEDEEDLDKLEDPENE
ncbi:MULTISPECIES: phage portal protein [Clostridium]|uniref:phage portal protein n=2 Tax=Clostridium TaxID=1485 RepID=UPI00232D57DC|nr:MULTISPECIES: phage portal protein [Clostridium]MDB2119606.1 phage portal protein [Clostridium paraputrificum]MDU2754188.1 phage portal protein [Clostridium sp.]MDU2899917.1 phage portal protein [Clostridium sp.]